jgi:hypothetical protein
MVDPAGARAGCIRMRAQASGVSVSGAGNPSQRN